jgi:hypothetical protein
MGNNKININEKCLPFNRCISCFFDCVKSIRIDGTYLNCCDVICQWIFHEKVLRFVNLKKLILIDCYLIERLIENL